MITMSARACSFLALSAVGGAFLVAAAVAVVGALRSPYVDGFAVTAFIVLGTWAGVAAFGELILPGTSNRWLHTRTVAGWNAVALCASMPACVFAHIYRDSIDRAGDAFRYAAFLACQTFVFLLAAAVSVLLFHAAAVSPKRLP